MKIDEGREEARGRERETDFQPKETVEDILNDPFFKDAETCMIDSQ